MKSSIKTIAIALIALVSLASCNKSNTGIMGQQFHILLDESATFQKKDGQYRAELMFAFSPYTEKTLQAEVLASSPGVKAEVSFYASRGTIVLTTGSKVADGIDVTLKLTETGPGVIPNWSKSNTIHVTFKSTEWIIEPEDPQE